MWLTKGSFQWENGVKDSKVIFSPNPQRKIFNKLGHLLMIFRIDKLLKNGVRWPGNEHIGAFGCDSYDISGTTDGRGSKGALHGLTKFSMEDAPPSTFFLEYVARPQTAEIFFEDVLMACVYLWNAYTYVKTINLDFYIILKEGDTEGIQ